MAQTRITELAAYSDPKNTDVLPVVDITSDVTKKVDIAAVNQNAALGTSAVCGMAFDGDPNTGIFSPGADLLSISTAGTERLRIDSVGQIEAVSLGTAAAPTYSFYTDPNTGIYSPGADQVTISTGGSGRLFVDASGNVGVGTNPNGRFHVVSATSGANSARFSDGVNSTLLIGHAATNLTYLDAFTNLGFYISGSEKMRLNSSGQLGVGTSSVTGSNTQLEVAGGIATELKIGVTSANNANFRGIRFGITGDSVDYSGIRFQANSGELRTEAGFATWGGFQTYYTNGLERLRITSAGLVGVGTLSPSSGLHLANPTTGAAANFTISNSANNWSITTGSTANSLSFIDNQFSANRLHIGANGVGIGTSAPQSLLHLEGSTATQNLIASTGNAVFRMANSVTSATRKEFTITLDNTNNRVDIQAVQQGVASRNITLNAGGGNVGIGTTSPGVPLEIYAATNAELRLNTSADGYLQIGQFTNGAFIGPSSSDSVDGVLRLGTGGTERARIDSSGNVGIGLSPVTRLDVQAGATASSSFGLRVAAGTNASDYCARFNNATGTFLAGIDGSGNVGIGTTSPGTILDVVGSGNPTLTLRGSAGAYSGIINIQAAGGGASIVNATGGTNSLAFQTNSSERARIDASGRLLVGMSTARSNFFGTTLSAVTQTEGTGGAAGRGSLSVINNDISNNPPYVLLGRSGAATLGSNAAVVSGSRLGTLTFHGADGTSFIEAATVAGEVDGTPGANDMPGRLVFSTTADGASSPTERFRITNDGVMCYNQAAPVSYAAAATLVIGDLKTGLVQYTGAAATLTMPTGTLTEGGFNGIYTNMTFEWSVINTGSGTCTIGAGTGHTIVGGTTVAAGTSGRFASRRTAANTFVTYRLT